MCAVVDGLRAGEHRTSEPPGGQRCDRRPTRDSCSCVTRSQTSLIVASLCLVVGDASLPRGLFTRPYRTRRAHCAGAGAGEGLPTERAIPAAVQISGWSRLSRRSNYATIAQSLSRLLRSSRRAPTAPRSNGQQGDRPWHRHRHRVRRLASSEYLKRDSPGICHSSDTMRRRTYVDACGRVACRMRIASTTACTSFTSAQADWSTRRRPVSEAAE